MSSNYVLKKKQKKQGLLKLGVQLYSQIWIGVRNCKCNVIDII